MSIGEIIAIVFTSLLLVAFIGSNVFIIVQGIKNKDRLDAILAGVVVTLYTSAFIISIIL